MVLTMEMDLIETCQIYSNVTVYNAILTDETFRYFYDGLVIRQSRIRSKGNSCKKEGIGKEAFFFFGRSKTERSINIRVLGSP